MIPESLSPIANHLWQSTLLAGGAGLLTLALRKNSARVRHWVWVVASLKFLVPFSVLVAIGNRIEWRTAPAIAPSVSVIAEQVGEPFTATVVSSPMLATVPTAHSILPEILLGIWACGFVGISLSWLIRFRRIRGAVRAGSSVELGLPIRAIVSPSFLEPGVFGVFRPILLLPYGVFDQLTPEQWQAVLAHELCHVRRRDNLIGIVHMFVEPVFWFHPMVWWIGKRIFQEREMACDEEVLRLGSEPRTYARGILKGCELYLESPVVCMAGVSGSNLRRRIEGIMKNRIGHKLTSGKRLLLAGAGVFAVAVPIAIGVMNAPSLRAQAKPPGVQTGDASPKFLVEVVKLNKSGSQEQSGGLLSGGNFSATNISIIQLIQFAYHVDDSAISGMPSWFRSDRFDVVAKGSPDTSDPELRMMMRNLLASEFKLSVRNAQVPQDAFALIVAKGGGPILKKASGQPLPALPSAAANAAARSQQDDPNEHCRRSYDPSTGNHAECRNISMPELAQRLRSLAPAYFDRPVVDQTGITGTYDLVLQWTGRDQLDSLGGLTIFDAVIKQLDYFSETSGGWEDCPDNGREDDYSIKAYDLWEAPMTAIDTNEVNSGWDAAVGTIGWGGTAPYSDNWPASTWLGGGSYYVDKQWIYNCSGTGMTPAVTGPGEGTGALGGTYNQKFYMGSTTNGTGVQVADQIMYWYDDMSE